MQCVSVYGAVLFRSILYDYFCVFSRISRCSSKCVAIFFLFCMWFFDLFGSCVSRYVRSVEPLSQRILCLSQRNSDCISRHKITRLTKSQNSTNRFNSAQLPNDNSYILVGYVRLNSIQLLDLYNRYKRDEPSLCWPFNRFVSFVVFSFGRPFALLWVFVSPSSLSVDCPLAIL